MKRRPLRPHFAHGAEHEHRGRRTGGEDVDRGAHGIGVGVVAIVDHRKSTAGLLDLQPARVRPKRAQPGRDRRGRDARRVCAGGGGERVAHVVQAGDGEGCLSVALRRMQAQLALQAAQRIAAAHRRGFEPELHHAPGAGALSKERGMLIVGVDDRGAGGGQRVVDARVLRRDLVDTAHELEVLALGVVDQRDGRRGDAREAGDLAAMIHAELDGAPAVRRPHLEQRERHADVVIQVAGGGEHRLIAGVAPQDCGEHFLHRGLAVGAGDGDEHRCEARAPVARELAKRALAVLHDDDRKRIRPLIVVIDHGGGRAAPDGGIEEVVPIEALAAQGDEEFIAPDRAAVGRHAGKARVGAAGAAAGHARCFGRAHHRVLRRASAARAAAWSENASRSPAISW